MAKIAARRPKRLWPNEKYDMHTIASGLPVECMRGAAGDPDADYSCSHASFVVALRRFAAVDREDVVFRFEPIRDETGDQVGTTVQFFWSLRRSNKDRIPDDFIWPTGESAEPALECSPFVREKYRSIPRELRAPVLATVR
jgi:hypothetical protein